MTYNIIMNNELRFSKTLGPVSSQFINHLLSHGKFIFSLNEAVTISGKKRQEAVSFLRNLVKRGILARIKSGVYCILQTGQEHAQLSNWPIIARELVDAKDYYISYYSAMRLHGMTTHPVLDIAITQLKRRATKKINNFTYTFVYSKPEHFWGFEMHWVTRQEKVCVSDLEKTILEGLARPELCGGMKEIVRGIWAKQKQINWDKIGQYAENFHIKAAVKRLAFILEILNIGHSCLPRLAQTIACAKDYIYFDPQGVKEGRYLSRWHICLNTSTDELKESIWS